MYLDSQWRPVAPSMDEVGAADRVLCEGRPDLLGYRQRIRQLSINDHADAMDRCPTAVERAIDAACSKHRRLIERTAVERRRGVAADRLHRRAVWAAVDGAAFGGTPVLAARLGGLYPKHDQPHPIHETQALVGGPGGGGVHRVAGRRRPGARPPGPMPGAHRRRTRRGPAAPTAADPTAT